MADLGSSPPAMITPAISSIQAATSTALPEPIFNDGLDSHVAIEVDAATSSSLAATSTSLLTSSPKDGSDNHVAVGIDAATVSTYAATSKIQAATSKDKAANSTTLPVVAQTAMWPLRLSRQQVAPAQRRHKSYRLPVVTQKAMWPLALAQELGLVYLSDQPFSRASSTSCGANQRHDPRAQ